MNYIQKVCGLINALDEAGIHIKGFTWDASKTSFDIDVIESDEERAASIAQCYWLKQQEDRLTDLLREASTVSTESA
jgi:hypothetical protein